MQTKINPFLFISIAFAIAFGFYWPALTGLPIWDDSTFLFDAEYMKPHFSAWIIWKDFNWPVSILSQKMLLKIWGHQYLYYHLLSLLIHFLNSYLLLKLSEKVKLPYSKYLFLLFLFHPANVISVGWMIQFKTLTCFTFAILSFLSLIRSEKQNRYYFLSIVFFTLSILSKSSSLPIPLIFLVYFYRKATLKQLLWLTPFFFLSLFSGYRVLTSPVTAESVMKLKAQPKMPEIKKTQSLPTETKTTLPSLALSPAPASPKIDTTSESGIEKLTSTFFQSLNRIFSTAHYYFWQTFLPLHTQPVKGSHFSDHHYEYYLHFFFLILVSILTFGTRIFSFLFSGYIMLLPFLGFIPAPFMNITWVSDQHLYLVIPFFLCFGLELLTKLKFKWAGFTPYLLLSFFLLKVGMSTSYYHNDITFYKASLQADPTNVPIGYNLVVAYIKARDINSALNIAESFVHMAEISPEIKNNKFYPEMFLLYTRLQPKGAKSHGN
jgi:hypothetical protein